VLGLDAWREDAHSGLGGDPRRTERFPGQGRPPGRRLPRPPSSTPPCPASWGWPWHALLDLMPRPWACWSSAPSWCSPCSTASCR